MIAYFRDRKNDLLTMRISEGEGWEMLCPFLYASEPMGSFHMRTKQKIGNDFGSIPIRLEFPLTKKARTYANLSCLTNEWKKSAVSVINEGM